MHEPDALAHGDDGEAGDDADAHRQNDHARFAGANDGAQAMRHFDWAAEKTHARQIHSRQPITGLNVMPRASASAESTHDMSASAAPAERIFAPAPEGDSRQKLDEKSGDFSPPSPLKNTVESTY